MAAAVVLSPYPIIPQIPEQEDFAEFMMTSCEKVVSMILQKKSFSAIVQEVGRERGEIARTMKKPLSEKFGVLRKTFTDRIATPLKGPYAYLGEKVNELKETDPSIQWNSFSDVYKCGYRVGVFGTKEIQLTKYEYCPSFSSTLAHTYPENLPDAFAVMDSLYQELLEKAPQLEPPEILTKIGRIHWWFVQAAPYFRGSASGGELIASALSKALLGEHLVWADTVIPDHVALLQSEKEFMKKYPDLLQSFSFEAGL